MMPEYTNGSSGPKDTEDTTKFELDSCQTDADMHVHIDEASWHTGETETSSQTHMDHCQQLVEMDGHWQPTYQWSHVDKHGEFVTLEGRGGGAILHVCLGSTRSRMGNAETSGSRADQSKEMQMYRKAIPLSRSAYHAANLNPIQIHS